MDPASDFTAWFKSNGGTIHPSVEFAWSSEFGYYMQVKKAENPRSFRLPKDTTVVSCPHSLALSALNALPDSPLRHSALENRLEGKGPKVNDIPLPEEITKLARPQSVAALWLCVQFLLRGKSTWSEYIALLPRPPGWDPSTPLRQDAAGVEGHVVPGLIDTAAWWTAEEKRWITGTNIQKGIDDLESSWTIEWEKWGSLFAAWAESMSLPKPDWTLFKWAVSIYGSRAFSSAVLSFVTTRSTERKILETYDPHALLYPGVDLLNHSNETRNAWYCDEVSFAILCNDEPAPGDQIYNCYGMKDNGSLLLSFGFALANNCRDAFALKLPQTKDPSLIDAIQQLHPAPKDQYKSLKTMLRVAAPNEETTRSNLSVSPRKVIALNETETLLSHDPDNNVHYIRSPTDLRWLKLSRSSKPNPGYPNPLLNSLFYHLEGFPTTLLTNLAARLANERETSSLMANSEGCTEESLWTALGERNLTALSVLLLGRLRMEMSRLRIPDLDTSSPRTRPYINNEIAVDLEAQTQAPTSANTGSRIEKSEVNNVETSQIKQNPSAQRHINLNNYVKSQLKILLENINPLRARIVQAFAGSALLNASNNGRESLSRESLLSDRARILTIPQAVDMLRSIAPSIADEFVAGVLTIREGEDREAIKYNGGGSALLNHLRALRYGQTEQDEEDIFVLWIASMFILSVEGQRINKLDTKVQHLLSKYCEFWRRWYGLGLTECPASKTMPMNQESNAGNEVGGIDAMANMVKEAANNIKKNSPSSQLWTSEVWLDSAEFFKSCVRIVREESVDVVFRKSEYEIFELAESGKENWLESLGALDPVINDQSDMVRVVGLYVPY